MKTATPETDAAWDESYPLKKLSDAEKKDFARKLEIERDSARRVLEHCRLFILKRLGYHATEEMERAAIGAAIEAILSENRELS